MNRNRSSRRGVILPLVCVLLVFLMGIVVFCVDVAYMQLARTQLQVATDAAAKAAVQALDSGLSPDDVKLAAIAAAAGNEVGGQPLTLVPEDITLGTSVKQPNGAWVFHPNVTPYTAARVIGDKSDGTASGAVSLFFAGIFGDGKFRPTRVAEASQFEHEIVLCVDRSHSLCFDFDGNDWYYPGIPNRGYIETVYCAEAPMPGSRWEAVDNAIKSFLNIVSDNNATLSQEVGLVTWASEHTSCSTGHTSEAADSNPIMLGTNFTAIRDKITALGADGMPGSTHMHAGLDKAIDVLTNGTNANDEAKKTLILFTDGQWNTGDDPADLIPTAQAENITIHVVSLLDNLDSGELDNIANSTGGQHLQASTPAQLKAAFEVLARSLPVVLTK